MLHTLKKYIFDFGWFRCRRWFLAVPYDCHAWDSPWGSGSFIKHRSLRVDHKKCKNFESRNLIQLQYLARLGAKTYYRLSSDIQILNKHNNIDKSIALSIVLNDVSWSHPLSIRLFVSKLQMLQFGRQDENKLRRTLVRRTFMSLLS